MLITTEQLASRIDDRTLVIADIRWEANQPEAGMNAYRQGHIPGAVFVDLDNHLSDRSDLTKGRHPLPDPAVFVRTLAGLGIGQDTQLVAYDDKGGSLAARLWWMMRWIGAPEAAVLDGGFPKWVIEGRTIETGKGRKPGRSLHPAIPCPQAAMIADHSRIETAGDTLRLLDARAPERYRGEVETIDARAGHIPGAINAPWKDNVTDSTLQVFKSAEELRRQFEALRVHRGDHVVCYCGSGVTACHNLLALEIAGLHGARLYPGSWSEWVATHPQENDER